VTTRPPTAPTAGPTTATASPVEYTEITKNAEGGHGGPPLVDLPAAFAVDYVVRGTCTFGIEITTEAGKAVVPGLTFGVTGTEVSGTWPIHLTPGRYYVTPAEAVGCTFSIKVRAGS